MKLVFPLRNVADEVVLEFSSPDMDKGVVTLSVRNKYRPDENLREAVFYAEEFADFYKVLGGISKFSV